MWSAHALRNFERYLAVTPKRLWGRPPARGAYDARGGAADHGYGRLLSSDFERGGAYDAAPPAQGDPIAFLKFIASKLSAEDWSELRERLCAGEEDEGDEAGEDGTPEYVNGLPKNGLEVAQDAALAAVGAGRIMDLNGRPVVTNSKTVVRELGDLIGRIGLSA
jgi:hypothetical protein